MTTIYIEFCVSMLHSFLGLAQRKKDLKNKNNIFMLILKKKKYNIIVS